MEITIKKTVDASKFDTIRDKWIAKFDAARNDSKAMKNLINELDETEMKAYRKLRADLLSREYAEINPSRHNWHWTDFPETAPKADAARLKRHWERVDRITEAIAFLAFANGMTTNMCAWDDYLRIFMLCECPGTCERAFDEFMTARSFGGFLTKIEILNDRNDYALAKETVSDACKKYPEALESIANELVNSGDPANDLKRLLVYDAADSIRIADMLYWQNEVLNDRLPKEGGAF